MVTKKKQIFLSIGENLFNQGLRDQVIGNNL
jgi:hypothetical protein